ncbi:MAG: hypothetical protein UU09_C0002G0021 [Microgenomates group bacterium GW2011_GWA2_40_6]|nr:MAG: hypothetical protein UU09_C0002G0021 [Microgenomates group bacterium GW2011_GWA2_40_6]
MTKRKILMITPYIPRLYQSGGQNSSYYSIKYLSSRNDITLICFSRDEEGLLEIQKYCRQVIVVKRGKTWNLKNILLAGFSKYPFLVINYISTALSEAIKNELDCNHFDLIHCDSFYPIPNIPLTSVPIVLVDLTIEYLVYQHYVESLRGWKKIIAPLLWIDVLKLKYWEIHYWKTIHTVVAFALEDQKLITKTTGRADIELFQNGVDKTFYLSTPKVPKSPTPALLFGFSNMKWMQNRESVDLILDHVWPQIIRAIPDCKLYIIGRFAKEFYGHLGNSHIIVDEADIDGGIFDRFYYLYHCWALVAPMGSGGGTRNKFLEAMACGLPVITTPEGMGGIKIKNQVHSIVCSLPRVAAETIKLLKNKSKMLEIGKNARTLITKNFSYEKCVLDLNNLYEKIISKK